MLIKIKQNCLIDGVTAGKGDIFEVNQSITKKNTDILIAMGRAAIHHDKSNNNKNPLPLIEIKPVDVAEIKKTRKRRGKKDGK